MTRDDAFEDFAESGIDPASVHMQCLCGVEYPLSQSRHCPVCGRRVPKAVSRDGAIWKTCAEAKLDLLRHMLRSGHVEKAPAERRQAARESIQRQIRQLEEGSWKEEARQRAKRFRSMLDQHLDADNTALARFSEKERQDMRRVLEMGIQTAQQELEAAGETP